MSTEQLVGRPPEGFRMPAELSLGPVRLQITNLERSLDFYERVLGLTVLDRDGGEAALGVAGSEPLIELRENRSASPVPSGGRLGLYHYAILLPDRPSLARFALHLSAVQARAGASDHLVSEAFYLNDPDGLGIEVYRDRPRSEWRRNGNQIAMDTIPLNLRDLASAVGDSGWQGMPEGTRMGHLHLHVGDIGTAERFYHHGLGLDAVVWGYPGALFLSAGGYHHHLGLNTWAAGAGPAGETDARLLDWQVRIPANVLPDAVASLRDKGFEVEESNGEAYATDPWGVGLRISPLSEN